MSSPLQTDNAVEIFYSYSHRDEKLRDELEKRLVSLKRSRLIRAWYDRNIDGGDDWKNAISEHLNSAHIILLLISPDFIASDYCMDIEMGRAIERHESREARIVPIILRPIDWMDERLSRIQALPTDAKPVTLWENQDQAFRDIALKLRAIIEGRKEPEPSQDAPDPVHVDDTTVPSLLPYMCDRSQQEEELHEALQRHQTDSPRRPFVCIIHGNEGESHRDFLRRLRLVTFPRELNLESKNLSLEEFLLEWPHHAGSPDRYQATFAADVFRALGLKGTPSPEELLKYVAAHEKPFMITSHLLNQHFVEGGTERLTAFLEYWDAMPDLPPGRTLISCVSITHEQPANQGIFANWRWRGVHNKVRSCLEEIDFSSYPGVSGVVLSELEGMLRVDAEKWTRLKEVMAICDIHPKEIRSIYQQVELAAPDARISMEKLADQLRPLIIKYRLQRN